ncbi:efflux RND transporter periplasmic adaptor subunit [Paraburkholderia kirstenboschensis]|uniref:Efflux RND transporter periplasmic adaptor subunit n=1 Tax=Paraburkholderia kirstenboschensis TaxID=1245436 RepID=A0ABZ0EC64_9BURK|nr:efflux RND transporter periplasmic adaptor subunit [Paraburkholderia kirstenboschensis]WOD13572.1 efflux RND transporter periplasmic adaptor subunit [Paraburkholderia kirstenboschensis]WOD13792.1 efflux RND transporter periplasmic adaptor subunit [Paraburkholderia kirstenboschensis]
MNIRYRNRLQLSVGAAGILVLCGALFSLHSRTSPAASGSAPPATAVDQAAPLPNTVDLSPEALANVKLQFAKAELRPGVHTIAATGVVAFNAKRLAQLGSPSKARIVAVDVAAGDHVRAGQRLATLDEFDLSDVRSQVASASAAVADANAAADAANAALQRGTELVTGGGIAQSELDRRRAAAVNAQAMLKSRHADLQKWQGMQQRLMPIGAPASRSNGTDTLGRQTPGDSLGALVAPFDGVISSVGTAAGNIVDMSSPIVTLADLSTMWVQANVPERDAAEVRPGQTVLVHIDAYSDRQFTGRVIDVADQVDTNTGTVAVRCELPNGDGALRANMFGTVDIQAPLGRDATLVPDAALQDVNGQPAVFIPTGNGRFAWRAVRTGYAADGMTQVVSGLSAGTSIVADGSYWLKAALMKSTIPDEG